VESSKGIVVVQHRVRRDRIISYFTRLLLYTKKMEMIRSNRERDTRKVNREAMLNLTEIIRMRTFNSLTKRKKNKIKLLENSLCREVK